MQNWRNCLRRGNLTVTERRKGVEQDKYNMAAVSFVTLFKYTASFALIAFLLPDAIDGCIYSSDCGMREVCCNYQCVSGLNCSCTSDSDCSRWQVCCGGKCDDGSSCISLSCTSDSDCSTGESCCHQMCFSGSSCVGQYCLSVLDCSAGESCCLSECKTGSSCIGSSCIFDDQCGNGETCCHKKCQNSHDHCFDVIVILVSVFGSIGFISTISACILLAWCLRQTRRKPPHRQQDYSYLTLPQNEPVQPQDYPVYPPPPNESEPQQDCSYYLPPQDGVEQQQDYPHYPPSQNNQQQQQTTTNPSSLSLKQQERIDNFAVVL